MTILDNELSTEERRQRALYNALSNELDLFLIDHALVDSFRKFKRAKVPYPFVEKRELKPRGKVSGFENSLINSFIVIFAEDVIPPEMKKHIRYFDNNKVNKENLDELKLTGTSFADRFQTQMKYFEKNQFYQLLRTLLPVDYSLLIQKDNLAKQKNRFLLSHFHVRIDCLIDNSAEALGRQLRYISKDLYENGEGYAQDMVEKLFEYYSFHHTVAGRRTAALQAAEFLKQAEFKSTIYVSSSESRTLTKITDREVNKFALVQLDKKTIKEIKQHHNGDPEFEKKFIVSRDKGYGIAIFQVTYSRNEHSKPPTDGKLREVKSDLQWLRIRNQLLMPKPGSLDSRPIRYQIIYDQQDPLS
jgi:hypothetical protein